MRNTCFVLVTVTSMFIPTFVGATALSDLTGATVTNIIGNGNNEQQWGWSGLTNYGLLLDDSAQSVSNGATVLRVEMSGANSASGVFSYAGNFSDAHTGTNSTNYGLVANAQSGTHNFGVYGSTFGTTAGDAGVWGDNSSSGATYGIYGTNESATGYAGYFNNKAGGYAAAFMGGNVGIGTASPAGILDVEGGTAASGNSGTNINIAAQNGNGTNKNGGNINLNVGAATGTGTSGIVNINGISGVNTEALALNNGFEIINDRGDGCCAALWEQDGGYATHFYTYASGTFQIHKYGTGSAGGPVLTIQNNGYVGIGTTAPSYLLHVGSSTVSGVVLDLQNSTASCTISPATSWATPTCSSDERLKDNIHDTESALAQFVDMRIRDYTVKSTGELNTGVIAQELRSNHPDMVHKTKNGFYSVDEPNPWKVVKSIQELDTMIAEQRDEISDLKKAVDQLKAQIKQSPKE